MSVFDKFILKTGNWVKSNPKKFLVLLFVLGFIAGAAHCWNGF